MRSSVIAWLLAAAIPAFGFQDGGQGAIAGQVVNQSSGAPLKDAIVTLRFMNPNGPVENMVRQTNDAGRFSFTNLWGAEWELSAESPGFAPGIYRATRYDSRGRFSLKKNEQINDVVLKLVPQAVVAGRVLDAEGKPVEGAHVTLQKSGRTGGAPYWTDVASAVTLDNGEYRIPRVASGRYVVKSTFSRPALQRLRSQSEVEMGYAATYYPSVTDPSLASIVDVSDGREIRGIDIQLAPTPLFHLRGRFQLPAEGTNSGQLLLLDRLDPTRVIATVAPGPPDYLFDISRIPPGSYLAYAKLFLWSLSQPVQAVQPVDVADRDLDGLSLRLARLPDAIPGVLRPKSEDRQVDLHRIAVRTPLIGLGKSFDVTSWSAYQIGKDLSFQVPLSYYSDVARFRVQVSDLPEGCYIASVRYGGAEVPERGVEYSPGATLVITVGVNGGRVDGVTAGEDDQPLASAVVGLFPADGKNGPVSTQSDARGAFHFLAIPPGDYKLIAWDDLSRDDLENPEFVKRFDSKATAISVAPSGSATVSLKIVTK